MRKPARKQGRSAQVDVIALTNVQASAPLTNVESGTQPLIAACSATADELTASRTLIDALEQENAGLKARHQTDQQMIDLLTELNETRKTETEALRSAIAAKNEALMAEDAVIAVQDKLIDTLKRKKSSPWKRLGDVLIGVGIGVLL
jgi:chromosome segregation ATPase